MLISHAYPSYHDALDEMKRDCILNSLHLNKTTKEIENSVHLFLSGYTSVSNNDIYVVAAYRFLLRGILAAIGNFHFAVSRLPC